ncbi:hypothetical protein JHK85_048589 [Glycine max]|nr:hypothetical protein JHK85_048589 [Glycine max]
MSNKRQNVLMKEHQNVTLKLIRQCLMQKVILCIEEEMMEQLKLSGKSPNLLKYKGTPNLKRKVLRLPTCWYLSSSMGELLLSRWMSTRKETPTLKSGYAFGV